jgi:chitin synthase
MRYQPIQLDKTMTLRNDFEGKSYIGLHKATGIKALRPDVRIRPGVLTSLKDCTFLIVVAMYNEAPKEVFNTLQGIIQNLKFFREHGVDPDKIGRIVICDGIKPFLTTVNQQSADKQSYPNKAFFNDYFDEEMIKNEFAGKATDITKELSEYFMRTLSTPEDPEPEVAHCFQQQVALDETSERLNLVWAVKQENKRKLNTHLWFFGGFCQYLSPEYVMLLDVGTMPHPDALFRLYECMKLDPHVAGCCGEIVPMDPKIYNMTEGAQVVEYKYAHIFDKALECVIGYITVLPGAFSAYSWAALNGKALWDDYFKSLCHPEQMNAYYSNIYLAEDRVLCLALVSTQGKQYTLKYVRSSVAETDVPEDFFKLLAQRRRWINGSWFALIDTLNNRKRINKSGHTCYRKCWLWFLMGYYTLNVIFSWFMVGAFFLAMAVMTRKLTNVISDNTGLSEGFMYVVYSGFVVVYLILLIINFFLAMGVKPHMAQGPYRWLPRFFAFYMMFIIALTIIFGIADDYSQSWAPWLVIATIASFLITPILYGVFHKILPFLMSFLLMTPTYVNIFITYAMCNIHDCTWGNRPDTLNKHEIEKEGEFKSFRTKWVIVWVLSNAAFAYFLNVVDKASGSEGNASAYGMSSYIYIYTITVFAILLLVIRFLFSMIFLVQTTFFTVVLPEDVQPMPTYADRPKIIRMAEAASEAASQPIPPVNPFKEEKPHLEVSIVGDEQGSVTPITVSIYPRLPDGNSFAAKDNQINESEDQIEIRRPKTVHKQSSSSSSSSSN